MNKYIVNFLCDIDVTIQADTEEEAKSIAENMLGTEHEEAKVEYVYIRDMLSVLDLADDDEEWTMEFAEMRQW